MARLHGPSYFRIYVVAEQYVETKLPEQYAPRVTIGDGIVMQAVPTIIAALFLQACADFLNRDSVPAAEKTQRDAQVLREALRVLMRDDGRHFRSLVYSTLDPPPRVDAPPHTHSPVVMESPTAERALWAIERLATQFEQCAADLARDRKNITFFYCLGRRWGSRPRPTAAQADAVYRILVKTINEFAPGRLADIKTDYDPADAGNEIRRLMRDGAKAAT